MRHSILLFILMLVSCGVHEKEYRFLISFHDTYYAVNLVEETPVYKEPDKSEKVVYQIEKYRIVRMNGSAANGNIPLVWYYIDESEFKGYSLSDNFKLFEHKKEAEDFLLDKYPQEGFKGAMSIYHQAEEAFKKKKYEESLEKLSQFMNIKEDLKEKHPIIYYSTAILIGKIYLKSGNIQRALGHFHELNSIIPKTKIALFGKNFLEDEISFDSKRIDNYLNNKKFHYREILGHWEVNYFLGKCNELKKDFKRAKGYYIKMLEGVDDELIAEKQAGYIKKSLDRLVAITPNSRQLKLLEKIKPKLVVNGAGRYFLLKMGQIVARNARNRDKKRLVRSHYEEFIQLFENRYKENPYPGEIEDYLKVKKELERQQ